MKREELKRYTSSEIEEIDDALLEASEDGTIKMTRVYIASEADSVMDAYEQRIHELEKALESRLKVIEDSRAQIETLTKALSENAIGHDWLAEKDIIESDNAAMKKRIQELENKNKNLRYSSDMWMSCCKLMSEGKRNVMSSEAIAEMNRIKELEAENELLKKENRWLRKDRAFAW